MTQYRTSVCFIGLFCKRDVDNTYSFGSFGMVSYVGVEEWATHACGRMSNTYVWKNEQHIRVEEWATHMCGRMSNTYVWKNEQHIRVEEWATHTCGRMSNTYVWKNEQHICVEEWATHMCGRMSNTYDIWRNTEQHIRHDTIPNEQHTHSSGTHTFIGCGAHDEWVCCSFGVVSCCVCCALMLLIHTHSSGAPHPMNMCVARSVLRNSARSVLRNTHAVSHSVLRNTHARSVLRNTHAVLRVCITQYRTSHVVCVAHSCWTLHTHTLCAPHPMNMCVAHSVL